MENGGALVLVCELRASLAADPSLVGSLGALLGCLCPSTSVSVHLSSTLAAPLARAPFLNVKQSSNLKSGTTSLRTDDESR